MYVFYWSGLFNLILATSTSTVCERDTDDEENTPPRDQTVHRGKRKPCKFLQGTNIRLLTLNISIWDYHYSTNTVIDGWSLKAS